MGLANQTIRYVFRATHIYHSIVQSSYSPEFLDSGIKRSLGLEVLARAFVVNKTMLDRIGILNAERQAVENGDGYKQVAERIAAETEAAKTPNARICEIVDGFDEIAKSKLSPNEFVFKAYPREREMVYQAIPRVREFIKAVEDHFNDQKSAV